MTDPPTGSDVRGRSTPQRRRPPTSVIVGGALTVLAIVFIVENRQPADIRVIIPVITMPLWAALAAMVVTGIAIGMSIRRRRR